MTRPGVGGRYLPGLITRPLVLFQEFPETPKAAVGWLQIQLVRVPRSYRSFGSFLGPPQAISQPTQPPVAVAPLGTLAFQPPRPTAHSKLSAPTVVSAPTQPPVVTTILRALASQPKRRTTTTAIGAPIVGPVQAPLASPLLGTLAFQAKPPTTHYRLSEPTVVTPAPPVALPLLGTLAPSAPPRLVRSRLSRPTVVTPVPPVVTTILRTLTAQPKRRTTTTALGAPIVGPVQAPPIALPLLGTLATPAPPRAVRYLLSRPTAIGAPPQPPVVTRIIRALAPAPQRRQTVSTLGVGIVGDFVPPSGPPVVTTLRVTLARTPQPGRGEGYGLAPPAIIDLPPFPPVKVTLASVRRPRKVFSRLQQPTVYGTPTAPFVARRTQVKLVRRPRTRTISCLGAPRLVKPKVGQAPGMAPQDMAPLITSW